MLQQFFRLRLDAAEVLGGCRVLVDPLNTTLVAQIGFLWVPNSLLGHGQEEPIESVAALAAGRSISAASFGPPPSSPRIAGGAEGVPIVPVVRRERNCLVREFDRLDGRKGGGVRVGNPLPGKQRSVPQPVCRGPVGRPRFSIVLRPRAVR